MEQTVILNPKECGYTYFMSLGKSILGCGIKGGVKKLHIKRVLVIAAEFKRQYGLLGWLQPTGCKYDVDIDIYLEEGGVIQVHSSDPKFLKKVIPHIWELHTDKRAEFYTNRRNKKC